MSLDKNINPSLVLVQPRKIRPFITERLLMGRKESNQKKKKKNHKPIFSYILHRSTRGWRGQGGTSFVDLLCFCSVLCLLCFVCVCLYVLRGHLLGKGWPLGSRLWCLLWVCHFPIGILGQVWYLIVSIPDLCNLTYFTYQARLWERLLTSRGLPSDSTCVLKAKPGKLDIKRHEPGILFISLPIVSFFKLAIMT